MLQSLYKRSPWAPSHQCLSPGPKNVLTVERANEMKQIDFLGKNEVWNKLQAMRGEFEKHHWVDISDTGFGWWRWVANIAQHRIDFGVREAWVTKNQADWFEFMFVNDPDPAQPGTHPHFTIMLWKERGKRLEFRVE